MHIHESAEEYLEAILRLRETKGLVRSVDISQLLGVTKPSVSFAMKKLRENEYIHMDQENLITLTEKGRARQEQFKAAFLETEAVLTRGLTEEEVETLFSLLLRVICNLEEDRKP